MTRAVLPQFDNNNGWLEILPPLPAANVARGDLVADIAIVGAGFTGLAAARRLAELLPDKRVLLLDANRVGNNSAGRSSGFAIDQAHNIRATNFADNLDVERNQTSLNRSGQDYLRKAVHGHDIDCDWDECGKVHAAATTRGETKLCDYSSNLDLMGTPFSWLDADAMKSMTGTDFYKTGIHTPGTIMVQPAKLVLGLARTLPENVTLFEDSPVTSIDYGTPHVLHLPTARIEARQILLANNGFAGQFGFYKDKLIPIVTWGSLTRPLTLDEQAILGGESTWNIIPADPFGTSCRRTKDNRILIRGIYSYSAKLNPLERDRQWARARHEKSLKNRFPMLPDLSFDFSWGGPLSLSRNGEPVFGELAPNVFGAFCLNGIGIARGTAYGKCLAELVAEERGPLLDIMLAAGRPNVLPPRPLLGWGVRVNFASRRHNAGMEL